MEKELEDDLEAWGKKALGLRPYSDRMMDLKAVVAEHLGTQLDDDDFEKAAEIFCNKWVIGFCRPEAIKDLADAIESLVMTDSIEGIKDVITG